MACILMLQMNESSSRGWGLPRRQSVERYTSSSLKFGDLSIHSDSDTIRGARVNLNRGLRVLDILTLVACCLHL